MGTPIKEKSEQKEIRLFIQLILTIILTYATGLLLNYILAPEHDISLLTATILIITYGAIENLLNKKSKTNKPTK